LNDIPATSNSFLSIAPKTHLDPPPQFETMSFLDTLDGYVIPPQNNRQSHTLTSSSKPGEVSSTKTTRIKREAIVQSIRKAMEDDDDDDDLGDGDGNGDGDGDGDGEGEGEEVNVDGGKRLKREETPTRAITFISSDEPLTRLGKSDFKMNFISRDSDSCQWQSLAGLSCFTYRALQPARCEVALTQQL